MISYLQAIILGVLQGVSELFPVSSLGHSVILPRLLNWDIHQNDSFFIVFLVATHLATALVLFMFFRKDWFKIIGGILKSLRHRKISEHDTYARIGWLLVIGTIPAGILGLLLAETLQNLFASARVAAFFLMLNGGVLYGAEILRKKSLLNSEVIQGSSRTPKTSSSISTDAGLLAPNNPDLKQADQKIAKLRWAQAFKIGVSQAIALIPGFSRSGLTMAGSLLAGLSNEEAARFSFLLATPIIGAAALLKLPELFYAQNRGILGPAIIGALCAGLAAYLAVRFLLKYFETNRLTSFAVYCFTAGLILSIYFFSRGTT